MNIEEIFFDKLIKAKGKVMQIGEGLINEELNINELLTFAQTQNAVNKATCIEAIEYATKKTTSIADLDLLNYVTNALLENEPRIKWESAKVIGNIAKVFPENLTKSVNNLLHNTENKGTVVRWATAYALGEILKLETKENTRLLAKIEELTLKENDTGVNKKYIDALKKVKSKKR